MMRRLVIAIVAIFSCIAPALAYVGFYDATSWAVVVPVNGQDNAFPGLAKLQDGRYIVTYNNLQNQPNNLLYRLCSSLSACATAPVCTLYTPSPTTTGVGGSEVFVSSDGYVSVTWFNFQDTNPLGVMRNVTGVVNGTTGGLCNDGITWGAPVTIASSLPGYGGSAAWTGPSKVVETSNGWMLFGYGGVGLNSGIGAFFSTDHGATWPTFSAVAPPQGLYFSETNCVVVTVGYPNAGRIVCIVRHDNSDPAIGGYYRTYCDGDPTVAANWSALVRVIAAGTTDSVGRPGVAFAPIGTNGALFLIARFDQKPRTGYTVSWDQGVTWEAVKKFGPIASPSPRFFQNWYTSAMWDSSANAIIAVVAQALDNSTSTGWIEYRKFLLASP